MNNAYVDKAQAEKEKIQANLNELKAQIKIAAADVRIEIHRIILIPVF